MSLEANKALVRQVTAALNARDWEALRDLMAPEVVAGLQADPFLAAFPDVQIVTEDMLAEGDKVVSRWIDHATHTGTFMGIPPTGRRVRVAGISIDRIAHGKIVETWLAWDELGLLRQLGGRSIPS
jgi:predicted ester cyclase